eukprot:gene4798-119_t
MPDRLQESFCGLYQMLVQNHQDPLQALNADYFALCKDVVLSSCRSLVLTHVLDAKKSDKWTVHAESLDTMTLICSIAALSFQPAQDPESLTMRHVDLSRCGISGLIPRLFTFGANLTATVLEAVELQQPIAQCPGVYELKLPSTI